MVLDFVELRSKRTFYHTDFKSISASCSTMQIKLLVFEASRLAAHPLEFHK